MIQTTERSLNPAEREEIIVRINALLNGAPSGAFANAFAQGVRGFIAGCAAAFLVLLLDKPLDWAWIAIGFCTIVSLLIPVQQPSPPPMVSSLLEHLRNDKVVETTVIASDAIRVAEPSGDDTTAGYFFATDTEEVLFVWEETLGGTVTEEEGVISVPSVFTITRYVDTGEIVSVTSVGPDMPISQTMVFSDEDVLDTLSDGAVFSNASLNQLDRDLPELSLALPALPAEQPADTDE